MAVTKGDLAEHLFEELGLNKREAKDLVKSFFEEIRRTLELSEEVKLSGFGNFELREKKERPGRNPKTGVEAQITARRVVTFRLRQKLKARMDAYAGGDAPPVPKVRDPAKYPPPPESPSTRQSIYRLSVPLYAKDGKPTNGANLDGRSLTAVCAS